jgi:hypothetical protein
VKRILVALVALVALSAGAAWIVLRQERVERDERRGGRLLSYDERLVTGFTVETAGVAWHAAREGQGWRLDAPVRDAASTVAVARFLATLREAPVERVIREPDALASYGLDPPVARVRVEGPPVPALEVGETTPTRDGVFARVEGRPGVLVLNYLGAAMLARLNPNALRDASVTGLSRSEVKALSLAAPRQEPVRLERRGAGWWIVRPVELPASDAAVGKLLDALEGLEIRIFEDGRPATDPAFGLPGLEIGLESASGRRTVRVGGPSPDGLRWVTRDDRQTVMGVDPGPLEALPARPLVTLADTRLTKLNRYEVTRFSWASGGERVEAERRGEAWTAGGRSVPGDDVLAFLARALEAPVRGWEAAPGPGRGGIALTVSTEDGATTTVRVDGHRASVGGVAHAATLAGAFPEPPASLR